MTNDEKTRLIEAWIEAQIAGSKSTVYENNWWAVEALIKLPEDDPELAWELIILILEHPMGNSVFPILSAGPLETLMCAYGEDIIERIEAKARANDTFKNLMQGVVITQEDTAAYKRFYEIADIEPPID